MQGSGNTGIDNNSTFIRDVDPKLFYLDSEKYPLVSSLFTMGTKLERSEDGPFTLKGSNKAKMRPAKNMKFEWTESERLKFEFTPTTAVATGDATIAIASTDDEYFVAGNEILLTNASGDREVARVTAVANAQLTVTRNIGSTGAIALTTADKFYNMGVIRAEDSVSTDPRQTKSETLYNYLSFISEPYALTLIRMATADYHGDPYQRVKMEALDRVKQKLELMFWFGHRDVTASTTNPVYHNGGIMYWLESQFTDVNIVDAGGVMTKQVWDQWLLNALKVGSRQKLVFCSSPVMTAVSGFASNQLRPADVDLRKFGMVITDYQSPHGTVRLVYQPLFDEVTAMNGGAVCLDMEKVVVRHLEGNGINLNLRDYDDIQENDRSGRKGEWMGVLGVQIATGKAHSILKNVNG